MEELAKNHKKTKATQRIELEDYWRKHNPILEDGELVFSIDRSGNKRFKIGDGETNYCDLNFIDKLSNMYITTCLEDEDYIEQFVHDDYNYIHTLVITKDTEVHLSLPPQSGTYTLLIYNDSDSVKTVSLTFPEESIKFTSDNKKFVPSNDVIKLVVMNCGKIKIGNKIFANSYVVEKKDIYASEIFE